MKFSLLATNLVLTTPLADILCSPFGRWAIKEAAYKAAYPIIKPTWKELTFAKMEGDVANLKPVLAYHPSRDRAQAREGSGKAAMRMHASVSHDGDYIFATVLVESE